LLSFPPPTITNVHTFIHSFMALPLAQAKNGDKIVGGGLPPVFFSLEGSRGLLFFFIIFCAIDLRKARRDKVTTTTSSTCCLNVLKRRSKHKLHSCNRSLSRLPTTFWNVSQQPNSQPLLPIMTLRLQNNLLKRWWRSQGESGWTS
jgi:hypothetical protein